MISFDNAKAVASEFDKYKKDGLQLYKDCQLSEISVSDYFEKLDPTPLNEFGQPTEPLDAFERHLAVSGIEVSGKNAFSVSKLANTAEYLMPELVLRAIQSGMSVANRFDYTDCIAATVPAKGAIYHPLYIPDLNLQAAQTRRDKSLGARAASAKGGKFPSVTIRRREKDITVEDNGRVIEAEYSVIRDYPWTDFEIFLRLVGAQLAADKLQNLYDLGITGDGTVGAATDTFGGAAGTLAYTDLITNNLSFESPFTMSRMLCPLQSMETILAMAQFQDPFAWSAKSFQISGNPVSPFGAIMKQVNATPGSTPTGTVIVTLDHNFAVREVVNQPLSVEADKIIAMKFEQAVVSESSRFSIIADGALRRIIWT